jgi:hypothetical protein
METLRSGNFSVSIKSRYVRKVHKNNYTYVALKNNSEYSILLTNHSDKRCDAKVSVDGKNVGKFRIDGYSSIDIDRPVDHARKFTFLRDSSYRAHVAGIREGEHTNGEVNVVFYPEKHSYPYSTGTRCAMRQCYSNGVGELSSFSVDGERSGMKGYGLSAGATALGNMSHQDFDYAEPLHGVDRNNIRSIKLRLIVDDKHSFNEPENNEWPVLHDTDFYPPYDHDSFFDGFILHPERYINKQQSRIPLSINNFYPF